MSKLTPNSDEVVIRLYGVGLGDCFLLAFPGPPSESSDQTSEPCYVLIDCGIAKGTPGDKALMKRIVEDIEEATGGTLDVLVVTHDHHDHVSGFALAEEEWNSVKAKEVWLSWLDGGGREADDIREVKKKLNLGVANAAQELTRLGMDVPEELKTEADFLGVSPFEAGESMVVKGCRIARARGENVFCEPGEVRRLPRTDFNAYVLGPPHYVSRDGQELKKGKKFLLKLLEDESEMYSYKDIGQVADGERKPSHTLSMNEDDLLANTLAEPTDDMHQPFDSRYRVDWETGMLDPFFQEHYSGSPEWRQINNDWLDSASDMALRAGGFTNNTSLVLAFEMPNSKRILLFPGDAQVGNWLSWHEIKTWTEVDGGKVRKDLTAENLLNRVIFYKGGHHLSHNATIRQKGLEMMALDENKNRRELVAYGPVSVPIAHDVMNYCPMPFYPVLKRLQEVANGHVYLANGQRLQPNENFPPDLPTGISVTVSDERHSFVKNSEVYEEDLPLYTEFRITDHPLGAPDSSGTRG